MAEHEDEIEVRFALDRIAQSRGKGRVLCDVGQQSEIGLKQLTAAANGQRASRAKTDGLGRSEIGGVNSCNPSGVRNAGTAMRMDVNALTKCANQRGDLQELLHRYVHALVTQIAQSGVCNRFHNIDARLARWLLMTHDRMGSDELHATQESIAHMLGVRRSSVTAAVSGFHKQHIIDYRRGRIEILDQGRLRAACCDCYALMKRQYDGFLN